PPSSTLFPYTTLFRSLLNKNKLSETGTYFGLAQNQKMPVEQAIQQAYGMNSSQLEQAVKDYFRSLAPLFQAEDAANRPGTTNARDRKSTRLNSSHVAI